MKENIKEKLKGLTRASRPEEMKQWNKKEIIKKGTKENGRADKRLEEIRETEGKERKVKGKGGEEHV